MSNLFTTQDQIILSVSLPTAHNSNPPAERLTWSMPLTTDAFTQTTPSPGLAKLGSHSPQVFQGQLKLFSLHKAFHDTLAPIISLPLSRLRISCQYHTLNCLMTNLTLLFDLYAVYFSGWMLFLFLSTSLSLALFGLIGMIRILGVGEQEG